MKTAPFTLKLLGISDGVNTCEMCGKAGIKCTVVISIDGADPVFWGRDCTAKVIYGKKDAYGAKIVFHNAKVAGNWRQPKIYRLGGEAS